MKKLVVAFSLVICSLMLLGVMLTPNNAVRRIFEGAWNDYGIHVPTEHKSALSVGGPVQKYELSNEGLYTAKTGILNDDTSQVASIWRYAGEEHWFGPLLIGLRSRGTLDKPTAVKKGDWSLYFAGSVHDGKGWERLGYMGFEVAEDVRPGSTPGMFFLRVTPNGKFWPEAVLSARYGDVKFHRQAGFDGPTILSPEPIINWDVSGAQVATVRIHGKHTIQPRNLTAGFDYTLIIDSQEKGSELILGDGASWLIGHNGKTLATGSSLFVEPGVTVLVRDGLHNLRR